MQKGFENQIAHLGLALKVGILGSTSLPQCTYVMEGTQFCKCVRRVWGFGEHCVSARLGDTPRAAQCERQRYGLDSRLGESLTTIPRVSLVTTRPAHSTHTCQVHPGASWGAKGPSGPFSCLCAGPVQAPMMSGNCCGRHLQCASTVLGGHAYCLQGP